MSLVSKLVSAAVGVGAAVAVGYGLKKLGDKAEQQLKDTLNPEPEDDTTPILGTADSKIRLKCSDGNNWTYTMQDKGIVKQSEKYKGKAVENFDFIPLKDGVTRLEFDYLAKGSDKPQRTITYNMEVKNGKIIRCDAAGDLEMIEK